MRSQPNMRLSDVLVAVDGDNDFPSIICRETVRCSVKHGGQVLRAVILTGSMARGEETYSVQDGGVRVMGDAEFVLVFRDGGSVPSTERMGEIRNEIENSLADQRISCTIGLSAVPPSFLTKSRAHVFAYELRTCGKVIWGEPGILELMPAFRPSDIPLEDAWRLLQNRVVEMLQFTDDFEGNRPTLPTEMHYRTLKLYLDMATSLLLFAGAYAPTYRQRLATLLDLVPRAGKEGWPFPLKDFVREVAACTDCKLEGTSTSRDSNFWMKAISRARQLWRWELACLTGARSDTADRYLFTAWMQKQPYDQRVRGWLFLMRHQGWLHCWRHWPRWARRAWQASPRYWIYLAASEFLFGLAPALESGAAENGNQFSKVLDYLPLRRDERGKSDWREIAREIYFNYYQLLVETRV